jgi:arylsulfatase A-like enzyme
MNSAHKELVLRNCLRYCCSSMCTKPNILIFMTDQQRADSVRADSSVIAPHIAQFRREAISFDNAFSTAPHCCPARASFHTGLYPSEHGVWNNVNVANTLSEGLAPGVRLFSQELVDLGYDLFFTGKWHISNRERPEDRGWREGVVTGLPVTEDQCEKRWRDYRAQMKAGQSSSRLSEGSIQRAGYGAYQLYGRDEQPFDDEEVIKSAEEYLHSRTGEGSPWTLFVGPKGPHDPYTVPQRFLDLYDPLSIQLPDNWDDAMEDKPALYRRMRGVFNKLSNEEQRNALRHYYAFCSYEDYLFGRILDALDSTGDAENTIVLYLSDHGDYAGEHGLWCKGLPPFDSAYRIPAMIRWPAEVVHPGRGVDRCISMVDFAPTLLEAAGGGAFGVAKNGSGRSLMPFLGSSGAVVWDDTIYCMTNGNELYGIQRLIRSKGLKYVYNGFDFDELYDLENDPGEQHNLIHDPEWELCVADMCAKIWAFGHDHGERAINPYIAVALAPVGPGSVFEIEEP